MPVSVHSSNQSPTQILVDTTSDTASNEFARNQRASLQIHPWKQQRDYKNETGSIKQAHGYFIT